MKIMDSKELILYYQAYLMEEGKVTSTIDSYVGDIRGFLEFLESKKVNFRGNLTRIYITTYKAYLTENGYTINTINKKINSLHSFNFFLVSKNLCTEKVVYPNKDKIKIARGSEGEIEVFSDEEVQSILFHIEDRSKISLRDEGVLLILLYTGLRVGELVNLKIKDIDFLTRTLKVVGKGGKYREVPLKMEVSEGIKEYMEKERKNHKHSRSEYLFLTQRAGKMDKDTVNKILNKQGRDLNLKMKPHKFRHTFCTRLLRKGVELTTVAKLAGHSNIQTTATFYINTSREDKQQAVNLL